MKNIDIIKKAYTSKGGNWKLVERFINEFDGICSDLHYNQLECPTCSDMGFELNEITSFYTRKDNGERMVDVYCWYPNELIGFGNNNGWVRINKKLDILPPKGYNFFINNNEVEPNCEITYYDGDKTNKILEEYTHFEFIPTPKRPFR